MQISVLALGALFAITGIILFARKGIGGKNTIKIFGAEFQLAGSSLVIFVLGCMLVFAALKLDTGSDLASGAATGSNPTNPTPTNVVGSVPPTPPEFVARYVYPTDVVERVEFQTEPGSVPLDNLDDFLRLTRVAFGIGNQTSQTFQVTFRLKNTSRQPILLDLSQNFFSLEDDHGRQAEPLYFCCSAKGDLLTAGQERTVEVFYHSSGWHGKNVQAHTIFLNVRGLLPIVRASWKMPTLATAD